MALIFVFHVLPMVPENLLHLKGIISQFLRLFCLSNAFRLVFSKTILPSDSLAASFEPIITLPSSALPSTARSDVYPEKKAKYLDILI